LVHFNFTYIMKLQKQKDQSVQCTIQDTLTNPSKNENLKPSVFTKKNADLESISKNTRSKFYY